MRSILVVDDASSDRELLATVLRDAGYEVFEARDRDRALTLARSEHPDLLIADILLPAMDGYDLVRELRDDDATAHIPVIFLAATHVIDEVRHLAAACGVSHLLIKPCAPEELISVVEEAISLPPEPAAIIFSEEFHRQHLRLVNTKLLQKVEELREAVILAGTLQRESDGPESCHLPPLARSGPELESLLSRRELEVLRMIVDGATNGEIAERLVIATSTVQSHVKRILNKLGARNRTEAAVLYIRR